MGRCKAIVKNLITEDGLLLTDLVLTHRGQALLIERVLVDTGSGGTIISTDLAASIGIIAEENDTIYRISGVGGSEFVYSKTVDSIKIGKTEVKDFTLEFGAMNDGFDLDGIIGLDFLQQTRAIIDIKKLILEFQ